jgi:DNA-binding MarR family transcriptional regulator
VDAAALGRAPGTAAGALRRDGVAAAHDDRADRGSQPGAESQLSKALLVHPTTITTAIDQLEKAGLVRRVPHPSDRRTILAELTAEGLQLAERASTELAGKGFGLPDISTATASRITADLRTVRQALGDLG